ncbi:MAG: hypothetical protein U0T77_12765 [Chitinophagales bacterium]
MKCVTIFIFTTLFRVVVVEVAIIVMIRHQYYKTTVETVHHVVVRFQTLQTLRQI